MRLTFADHDRDLGGMTYVYPVLSRRSRGISVGVNLNPNNACNWRCVYCQVQGLVRGLGPRIDLVLLESELERMLRRASDPAWLAAAAPAGLQRLNDVAFSGNGEPTSSPDFESALGVLARVLERLGLTQSLSVVLITNGSLTHKPEVQRGLARLAELGGEAWFKLDRATEAGLAEVNDARPGLERVAENLAYCARLVTTWIQTCWFAIDGQAPSAAERDAWLAFVRASLARGVALRGVLLYGLARASYQPEAPRLSALAPRELEAFGQAIRALGLEVRVHP